MFGVTTAYEAPTLLLRTAWLTNVSTAALICWRSVALSGAAATAGAASTRAAAEAISAHRSVGRAMVMS